MRSGVPTANESGAARRANERTLSGCCRSMYVWAQPGGEPEVPTCLRIRAERQKRGWTQLVVSRLAAQNGQAITQNEISQLERGRLNPTPSERDALARVFQVAPEALWVLVEFESESEDRSVRKAQERLARADAALQRARERARIAKARADTAVARAQEQGRRSQERLASFALMEAAP